MIMIVFVFFFFQFQFQSDFKNATGVETSNFPKKADLANLKSDVDKLDINKIEKYTK